MSWPQGFRVRGPQSSGRGLILAAPAAPARHTRVGRAAADAVGTVAGMTQSHSSARQTVLGRLRRLPRPGWPDVLAAGLLAYVGALNLFSPVTAPAIVLGGSAWAGTGVFAVLVAVCSVCVLLRRVVPTASVTITCLACVVHLACFDTLSTLVVGAGLLAVETTTSRLPRPWASVLDRKSVV